MKNKLIRWLYTVPLETYFRLLWHTLRKSSEVIDGIEIKYLKLPHWLMIGGVRSKTCFVDGMCLRHPPTKSTMIFLSKRLCKSQKFRYTLFHEYIESLGCFATLPPGYTHEQFEIRLRAAAALWQEEVPRLEQIITEAIENGQSPRHIQALILELELARREMTPEDYSNHLKEVMESRL